MTTQSAQLEAATFIIVGGGIAGVTCAETLSFLCPTESIVLLTETSLIKAVTNLVPLAKHILKFEVEEKEAFNSVKDQINVIVDQLKFINSEEKYIITNSNRKISYKLLCLCTGARPKLIENQNKYVIGIRDTDSILDFQKRIKSSRRLVLVGNGGIASEIAYEVKNIEIHWVIKDSHISSTFVDPGAAHFFEMSRLQASETRKSSIVKRMRYSEADNICSEKGQQGAALGPDWHQKIDVNGTQLDIKEPVKIHQQSEVLSIKETPSLEYPILVTLTNGKVISADFVVSATGVEPRRNFESDANFKLGEEGGITVNDMMETSIPYIYAAGDVCHAGWNLADHWFQMRLWTQARQMGGMAGRSMAAKMCGDEVYQDFCFELFTHVTSLFGYQIVLLGKYNAQGLGTNYEILLRMTPGKEYIKFVLQNGILQGAILIGDTGLEETCENLILNQIDLTPFGDDILNPDIDIEDYFD
ncbi:pyridine nucleotide-disulfide oxidoreductase domain-containing protein 1 [Episyrphus balteatus]|uniref:pyridine nucleotide-disulfide oxidoreductase domain-containing protein 1 n=1 Tax=Episyrphus balteatus TaxID=286459 RepID=UPI0024852FF4|nr:pyridine nucleotide-disulfide oxidoreductase domain-containing protein 1 [Episyrphus balteatus]